MCEVGRLSFGMAVIWAVDGTMTFTQGDTMDRSEKLHVLQVAALLSGRDPERLEDNIRLILAALENPALWSPESTEAAQHSPGQH